MHAAAEHAPISSDSMASNKSGGSNQPQQQGLPQTLMKLLLEGSAPEALWWLPGGNEFAIDAKVFPSKVLEVYFPGCKYASFIRRVHKM
jgi:HSF-type DNA-binding